MEIKELGIFNENNTDAYDILCELWRKKEKWENYYAYFDTKEGKRIKLSPTNYPDIKHFYLYIDNETRKIHLESPMKKEEATKITFSGTVQDAIDMLYEHAEDRDNVFIDFVSNYPATEGQVKRLYSADYYDYYKKKEYVQALEDELTRLKKDSAVKVEFSGKTVEEACEKLIECARDGQSVYIDFVSPYPATINQTFRLYSADFQDNSRMLRQLQSQLQSQINPKNEMSEAIKQQMNEERLQEKANKTGYSIEAVRKIEELSEEIKVALENGDTKTADVLSDLQNAIKKKEAAKRKNREEVELERVVNDLLAAKSRGVPASYYFKGHLLNSNTVTMDSAFMEVFGYKKPTDEEVVNKLDDSLDDWIKDMENIKRKAETYSKLDEALKEGKEENITSSKIINGLKFIAEHQSLSQDELINGLLQLGCNFSMEDIRAQFPNRKAANLLDGMKLGDMGWGADVIANFRNSEMNREIFADHLLSEDTETSIYNFIRVATGDGTYTKENIDGLNSSEGRKR